MTVLMVKRAPEGFTVRTTEDPQTVTVPASTAHQAAAMLFGPVVHAGATHAGTEVFYTKE